MRIDSGVVEPFDFRCRRRPTTNFTRPRTRSSNPVPSSEESANFHSLEPEALTDPARQALRSTRLVDLFIALRTASDECNP